MIFFVYGTLKKRFSNHYLLQDASFLGAHKTEPIYTLYDGGFPIVCRNGETAIQGELYQTDDQSIINRVFALEGYSPESKNNWYELDIIQTLFGEAGIFVMDSCTRKKIITTGKWG